MANTTNFGWETPDDTDLVKDGASAMRTLGNAIDTSLVDLKGGTTGQVLSKASNTDMDFTWVAQDDSNAIQNAIVDAKGDLITATAADTPARLAVGTNGQVLSADSTTSTGLKWITAGGGKVKQFVSAVTTTPTTIATTTNTDTGITATITPTSASNKIMVIISYMCYHYRTRNESAVGGILLRGATTIADYGSSNITQLQGSPWDSCSMRATGLISYYDSPATTSATTYKLQARVGNTADGGTSTWQLGNAPSTIYLLEIEV